MPIYEYRCSKCHKTFEKFQKISEDPITVCKDCGGKVVKLISQTSFSLKGSGWYKDGYSSAKANTAKSTSSSKETKSKTKSD